MRLRMKIHITGVRDGEPWPPAGGVIDVDDLEAAGLIQAGYAEEAPDDDPTAATEPAAGADSNPDPAASENPGPDADSNPDPATDGQPTLEVTTLERPSRNARRDAWVAYALSTGVAEESLTGLKRDDIAAIFLAEA